MKIGLTKECGVTDQELEAGVCALEILVVSMIAPSVWFAGWFIKFRLVIFTHNTKYFMLMKETVHSATSFILSLTMEVSFCYWHPTESKWSKALCEFCGMRTPGWLCTASWLQHLGAGSRTIKNCPCVLPFTEKERKRERKAKPELTVRKKEKKSPERFHFHTNTRLDPVPGCRWQITGA